MGGFMKKYYSIRKKLPNWYKKIQLFISIVLTYPTVLFMSHVNAFSMDNYHKGMFFSVLILWIILAEASESIIIKNGVNDALTIVERQYYLKIHYITDLVFLITFSIILFII
jgi:hypothetical protein